MTVRSVYDPPAGPLPGAVPGYWHEMRSTIDKAIALTRAGKCAKSKRVAWVQSPVGAWDPVLGVNGPPVELPCSGDQACRDACAKICTHAEERVLLRVLRDGWASDIFYRDTVAHLGLASPERLAMFGKGVQE